MPSPRGEYPTGWEYIVKIRCNASIPLLTTIGGVRGILTQDGHRPSQMGGIIAHISNGGNYEPSRGDVTLLQRRRMTNAELLREICLKIKHSGKYGICWWHKPAGRVWWVKAVEDCEPIKLASNEYSSDQEIKQRFMSLKCVRDVRIEVEAQPDPRRDLWREVFPSPQYGYKRQR